MGWESIAAVGFDLGPLLQGQMRIAKLKSAYNSLIIGPRGRVASRMRFLRYLALICFCSRISSKYAGTRL